MKSDKPKPTSCGSGIASYTTRGMRFQPRSSPSVVLGYYLLPITWNFAFLVRGFYGFAAVWTPSLRVEHSQTVSAKANGADVDVSPFAEMGTG